MAELTTMALLAAACWVFRITFVLLVPAERLPTGFTRGLGYLAPAVLAGLVAVELMGAMTPRDPRGTILTLAAVGVVALVAWRFRSLTASVVVGVLAVIVIDLLL